MTNPEPGIPTPSQVSRVAQAWELLRPALVLGGALAAALVVALFIVTTASRLLSTIVEVTAWAARTLNAFTGIGFREPRVTQTLSTQLDLGIGAFGAAVLVATLKDISGAVVDVISKWRSASGATLAGVFVKTLVGATGLWLSVYGAEKITNGQGGQTLTIDSASFPPAMVDPNSGNLTFYVGFYAEGGPETFENPQTHQSVNVARPDEVFLERLKNALSSCGAPDNKVKIRIDGFASGSQWTTVTRDLLELRRRTSRPAASSRINCSTAVNSATTDAQGPGTIDDALECIAYYKADEVKKHASTSAFEDGKAFNVYLANMRRLQVARRLGLIGADSSAAVTLVGDPWSNFTDMESALVIDDSRNPRNNFAVVGLLTRSARISIESAAGCAKPMSGAATRTQLVLQ